MPVGKLYLFPALGGSTRDWDTTMYSVPLEKADGTEVRLLAVALDHITEPLAKVNVAEAARTFNQRVNKIKRPTGEVDLLIGIQAASIFPTVLAVRNNLWLMKSQFGTGLLLDGALPSATPLGGAATREALSITKATLQIQARPSKASALTEG